MSYICENELRDIYNMLAPVLTQHGFACEIAMIRDYMLKIWIDEDGQRLGKLIVHYSPKKNSFSYRKDLDLSQEQYDRVVSLSTGQISMLGPFLPRERELPEASKGKIGCGDRLQYPLHPVPGLCGRILHRKPDWIWSCYSGSR